jgi:UDP-glucose 4-epimerase
LTIKRILAGKPPIIHGDGLQTRDYSYVEDIAEAITRIYEIQATRGRVVNLASGKEIEIRELIGLIMKLMGYSGEVVHEKARSGDVRRHRGDISLAETLIDYHPKTDALTGLKNTIDWYKKILDAR